MSDMEERPSLVVECPHCHVRVLPIVNNICPACRNDMSNLQKVDPNQVALAISESEELPSFCYSCNRYTERSIRVSGDKESDLAKAIFGLASPENTSNVIVYIPQCEECAEWKELELVGVDYDHQIVTIAVHKGFQERVLQLRDNRLYRK